MKHKTTLWLLSTCVVAGIAGPVNADDAGTVIFARGAVSAERQPSVPLAKGDAVLDNDTVATGDASRAQLLLTDGTKIAIRPNSRFRFDEYIFAGQQTGDPDNPVVSTSDDRSVATLIKGGFRTITGAIGKENRDDYEVRTPVGVLGIRGTDYSAVFCNADCTFVPGVNANAPIADGLYLGVTEGEIVFRNEIADINLQAGQFAFIPLTDRVPVRLEAPPPVLVSDDELRMDDEGQSSGQQGSAVDARGNPLAGFDSKLGARRFPATGDPNTGGPIPSPDEESTVPLQPINAIDADGSIIDLTPGDVPGQQQPGQPGRGSDQPNEPQARSESSGSTVFASL